MNKIIKLLTNPASRKKQQTAQAAVFFAITMTLFLLPLTAFIIDVSSVYETWNLMEGSAISAVQVGASQTSADSVRKGDVPPLLDPAAANTACLNQFNSALTTNGLNSRIVSLTCTSTTTTVTAKVSIQPAMPASFGFFSAVVISDTQIAQAGHGITTPI